MSAAETMSAALRSMTYREQVPPCADGSDRWTSEDYTQRAETIPLCVGCSLLARCAQYATELKASFGVWAGIDRTPTTRKGKAA
ncbi:MAG TPA: WhiB family transcriptional regulator [Dermatophilaceae bacterium]|jgi:hypothetical protein